MDQIGVQEQKKKYDQTLKKVTKLLFSISLFSFFFAQLLPLSWLPFHLLFHYHSTLRFHLFNQPIDKNSMFLLCNGLLVFLANYSGLFKSLSSSNSRPNYDYSSFKVFEFEKPLIERSETTSEVATQQEIRKHESEESGRLALSSGSGGEILEESIISIIPESGDDAVAAEEDNYGLGTSFFAVETVEDDDDATADDDQEGNNGGGVLSDEELNRKFDEFIKRMKEEIIVDPPRTLVVV